MLKEFTNEYAHYSFKDGIIHVTYRKGVYIDLSAAEKVVADRLRFQESNSYPVLCDASGIIFANKPARDYLAVEGSELITAVAYIVTQQYMKMVTSFYIRITKPRIPFQQAFDNVEDALTYLNEFRVNSLEYGQ